MDPVLPTWMFAVASQIWNSPLQKNIHRKGCLVELTATRVDVWKTIHISYNLSLNVLNNYLFHFYSKFALITWGICSFHLDKTGSKR